MTSGKATEDSPPISNMPHLHRIGLFNREDASLLCGLIVVAIASTLPFFYAAGGELPQAGDLIIHWPRMLMFDEALRSGVWYPRWLGGMNYGYGAATTMFYAPFVYYALSAAHALLGDWPRSVEAVAVMAAIGSVTTLYFYARSVMSRAASAVAALLYLLLPYRLIDLYHRGALAELIAFVWMPLVVQMFGSSIKRPRASKIIFGAIAFALLLITHPPVAYAFSVAFAIFAAVLAVRSKSWRPAVAGGLIVALGSALSAFYWLPAIVEVGYVNQSITDLFDQNKGYVTSLITGSVFEKLIAATFIVTGVLFLFLAALARSNKRYDIKNSPLDQHACGWTAVGLVSIFMILPIADPLTRLMPGISGMAFVWRWLAVTSLATSVLAGAAVERTLALNRRGGEKTGRARIQELLAAALAAGAVAFGVISCARASNLRLQFVAPADYVEQDFTPAGAPGIDELPRNAPLQMVSNSPYNQARLVQWKPQERVIEVTCRTDDTLRVHSFMYPGWEAFTDGVAAQVRTDDALKVMLIDAEQGSHTIKLVFANTPTRSRAQSLSLIALSCAALTLVVERLTCSLKRANRV